MSDESKAPVEHDLKCWDPYFTDMKSGLKPYEIRLNDRDYRVGDTLLLRQYNPKTKTFSGDFIRRKVVQMVTDFVGLAPGYVAMGVAAPTVKELKRIISRWPEIDHLGDETEVWIETGENLSSSVTLVCPIDGESVIFQSAPFYAASKAEKESGK